ncbi:hypothetical protein GDO81_008988 [Engystomops pustulosus]|uniref:Hexosyltransferase n=1 Tax=Engystomops pustulosus TaxID=76066 RepID=A0AAV7BMS0_ENGPU|nr:hypothetical protein GDO81_008988 [Engystomops pustulosus]
MDSRINLKKILSLCVIFAICFLGYTRFWWTQHKEIFFQVLQRNITPLYPYLIEEEEKCRAQTPFLLLLIPSDPQEFHIRNVLRNTWANESLLNNVHIIRLFLLGRTTIDEEKVINESSQFHDIVMQDFIDSYYNLTVKTLMGMEWVARWCPGVRYVVKIDTDMFFNPWFLVKNILQPEGPPKKNFFTGFILYNALPHRDKGSKWYMSMKTYSKKFYPLYCSGTGYVFSGDLAEKIYWAAEGLQMFPFEDVFVGMCLQKLGVTIFESSNKFIGEKIPYDRCKFTKIVTVHRFTPEELLTIWPDFLEAMETCSKS